MAHLIPATTITDAWLQALGHLHRNDRAAFDLVVAIADPTPEHVDPLIVDALDHLLSTKRFQDVTTVRNTIFPVGLARSLHDRDKLYERYTRLLPTLRRIKANRRGIYFERLINYALIRDAKGVNQIERIIMTLQNELSRRETGQGPLAHVYEAQIHIPGRDNRPMGFPCMSSLSFHLDGPNLRLSATYRNQYYIRKALGNFLGLAELQRFIADAVRLNQGPLSVHAFHAEIDPDVGKQEAANLLHTCEGIYQANTGDVYPSTDATIERIS
jgi:hypothetical protein